MTEDPLDGYPIDEEYIGVKKRRADVSQTDEEEKPPIDRTPVDHSHVFGRGYHGLSRGETDRRERDDESYTTHDGRAETRTTFWASDGATRGPLRSDGHRVGWDRLARWNDGQWSKGRDTANNAADQRRWVDIFGSYLDLTPLQRQKALEATEDVDMSHMAHYSSEVVILSIISLVANADGRWVRDEKPFRKLVLDLDTSLKDIRQCRQLAQKKTEKL